jgi:hypothetical protein
MKSDKQRRMEIKQARLKRAEVKPALRGGEDRKEILAGSAPCKSVSLAPSNSVGVPEFVQRGFYLDVLFRCAFCQKQEVWRATQQKWWYEVAKGSIESKAKLCNPCRKIEQVRRTDARRVHLGGLEEKRKRLAAARGS